MMEAFKAGEYDFRVEQSAGRWAADYRFPAVIDGTVKLESLPHGRPSGMFGFVFNTRRPFFRDRAVRGALSHVFDFAWTNRVLLHGSHDRIRSIFDNSELASRGIPDGGERRLLEMYRHALPPELFDQPYRPPGTGMDTRSALRAAQRQLVEAGWTVRNGRLRRVSDGLPMSFEILIADPDHERVALAYADNLKRLGIGVRVRTVDASQYSIG